MKVALCTHGFVPPFVGGVDVYTDRLSRALKRLGHETVIIAVDGSQEASQGKIDVSLDSYRGDDVWRIKFSFAERPKEAFDYAYDPEIGEVVKGILQEQRPDLFIIMNIYAITLAPVESAKSLGIPVVHIATDFLPVCLRATFIRWDGTACQVGESIKTCATCFVSHRTLGRLASPLLERVPEQTLISWAGKPNTLLTKGIGPYLRRVDLMENRLKVIGPLREAIDLVLAPTKFTQNTFTSNGFRTDQVRFLPFGVDTNGPLSRVETMPASHVRFLFIGRFQPYKGTDLLVEAFNQLESPNGATLTVYGAVDENYRAYYRALKSKMDSNPRIDFAGTVDPSELDAVFAQADFFVLPSTWHENSPLILLDALQSKTPVIASNVGGVTDLVKDEVNGLLFPMGDKQTLQHLMQRVIDRPTLLDNSKSGVNLLGIDDYARSLIKLSESRITN